MSEPVDPVPSAQPAPPTEPPTAPPPETALAGPAPTEFFGPPPGPPPGAGPFQPVWRVPREPWINPNRRAHVALVALVAAAAVFIVGVGAGWVGAHRHPGWYGPDRGYRMYMPGPNPWPEPRYLPVLPHMPATTVTAVPTVAPTTPAPSGSTTH